MDDFFAEYGGEDDPLPGLTMSSAMRWTRAGRASSCATTLLEAEPKLGRDSCRAADLIGDPSPPLAPPAAQRNTIPAGKPRYFSSARIWLALSLFSVFAVLAGFIWAVPAEHSAPSQAERITKNIEDVEVGDWVMAWDEGTGEVAPRQVVRLFRNTSDHVRTLTIGVVQEIHTTDGHPFWVPSRGWVHAGELGPKQARSLVACRGNDEKTRNPSAFSGV